MGKKRWTKRSKKSGEFMSQKGEEALQTGEKIPEEA
jgi:hypothetical protein